jgi:peptidyl-prolyl cis-trans isomerase B (cyclophilin B)
MPPGASSPLAGGAPTPSGGMPTSRGGGTPSPTPGDSSVTPPPVPTEPVRRSLGRPESRSAHRAAKRVATGRPPAGTPRRATRSSGTNWAIVGLAGAAVLVGAAVILLGNPFGTPAPSGSPAASGAASPASYGDGTCPTSQPAELPTGESRLVTITTDLGEIVIRVDGALSPIAAGNFVALAECEYYDGVVFHRTAALENGTPFVIQGGDPDGTGRGGPGYTIKDEAVTTSYHRGTVAMARSQGVDTQGSQFFIVLDDAAGPVLSDANTYAIFGEVVSGMDVADSIYQASAGEEIPTDPIVMTTVTVEDAPAPSSPPSVSPAPSASAAPTSPATSP